MLITQTPVRISFAGGGTDFRGFYEREEGAVVSSAIDKYVYVIVKQRFDRKIYINWSKKEIVDHIDEIEHELVREAMRKTGLLEGVEITTLADIPSEGSGLGSSSSLTVGLLSAFHVVQGDQVSTEQLAREACEVEIDICSKPIGIQDQYIAAYGNMRSFRFHRDGTVKCERLPIPESKKRRFAANLLLFFTNRTRKSSEILTEQRRNIPDRMEVLRGLKGLAEEARYCLENGFVGFGEILHRGWTYKKQMAGKITDEGIDGMYNMALEAGAEGGKICGAGGGGFLLLYVPMAHQNAVREALSDFRELPFSLEEHGSRVIFNMREGSLF